MRGCLIIPAFFVLVGLFGAATLFVLVWLDLPAWVGLAGAMILAPGAAFTVIGYTIPDESDESATREDVR